MYVRNNWFNNCFHCCNYCKEETKEQVFYCIWTHMINFNLNYQGSNQVCIKTQEVVNDKQVYGECRTFILYDSPTPKNIILDI